MASGILASEVEARAFVAERCDEMAMARLEKFAASLQKESASQNLIARSTLDQIWLRHIADSAQLLDYRNDDLVYDARPWLDLGSGAGPPGLVIAAMRPDWPVVLVESRKRRIAWLEEMRVTLNLPKCTILGGRLEGFSSFPAAVISARAFAPMPRLIDLSARFSTGETLWLLPKGRSAAQDLAALPIRSREMFHVEQSRTDAESGIIIGRMARKRQKTKKARS